MCKPSMKPDVDAARFWQIFSAKIVLEVFGGAGAIWGFSEVMTLRNPESQELWRFNALTIGFIFFLRYLLQMKDMLLNLKEPAASSTRLWQIFGAKLVLEVFGGGGAIWGFSESLTLRNPDTQEFWRMNAAIVGGIFLIRWFMQLNDFLVTMNGQVPACEQVGKTYTRAWQIFSAKMVLEVWGGAGAIWGFSEAATLRNPVTNELWRFNALVIGFIFMIRFLIQLQDYVLDIHGVTLNVSGPEWVRWAQIFSAKMVLEVWGGAGAIWGFSEAATFRVPVTNEFWRFNALVIGFIFFIRFCMQAHEALVEAKTQLAPVGGKHAEIEGVPLTA